MKRIFLFLAIFSVIIGAIIIILISFIDWGRLAADIIQRNAKIKITYERLEGSIFSGFQIKNYKVWFSPTDSIYGETAQIGYRLSPLRLRLPALFEIVLLEPVINLKRKRGIEGGDVKLPLLNLALRINIKNGRLLYEGEKSFKLEGISGLLFIDFVGKNLYLTTMNLSFYSPDYPLNVTSANLTMNIDRKGIQLKSCRLKGRGFFLDIQGSYQPEVKGAILRFENSFLNFDELPKLKGRLSFRGEVSITGGKVKPSLRGLAQNVYLFDQFNFETNNLGDTIIVNIFDGRLLDGTFSGQIKGVSLEDFTLEFGFKNLAINRLFNFEKKILISGYGIYHRQRFLGVLSSPAIDGVDIDSLKLSGSYSRGSLFLDSLVIRDTLFLQGELYPKCNLSASFNRFNLKRFAPFLPIEGNLSGSLNLKGEDYNLTKLLFNARLSISSFTLWDFKAQMCEFHTQNFIFKKELGALLLDLKQASYKQFLLDSLQLNVVKGEFSLRVGKEKNCLKMEGKLRPDGSGVVESFFFSHNNFLVRNQIPIAFDLFKREIGELSLLIGGGILSGTLKPLSISYTKGRLEELKEILGIEESLSGMVGFTISKDELLLNGEGIYFSHLKNGRVSLVAEYEKGSLLLKNLYVIDDNGQELGAEGRLSFENSNLNIRFNRLRPWIFPFLNSFMEEADGLLGGSLQFAGNLKRFKLSGGAEVRGASFAIPAISAKFDSVSCRLRFVEDRIIFESAEGCMRGISMNKGPVGKNISGGGILKLTKEFQLTSFSFEFSFKDAPLQYQSFAYGIGSGNFSVVMRDGITSYNGNITIKEGIVPIEFGMKLEEEAEKKSENWQMNLKLTGERNIWLRNRDADIEFGGEAYIIKEQGPVFVVGSLQTKRGNFYWLNHTLKITNGRVNFIPEERVNPELDFWAELDTKERDPLTNQEIKIILHCFGKITEPIFEFFSEPPIYSEQDILTYLNLNITWRELESIRQGEYLGRILPQRLLAWLESDVSRRLRTYTGLDYFRIEAPMFEPEEKTKLTVGKYVSKNLFVTYTYDITSFSNEFYVEYFIDDRNEILIKRDETGEYRLQYQYRIRF